MAALSFTACQRHIQNQLAEQLPPGRGGFSQNGPGFVEIHASEVDTTCALCESDTPTTPHQPATTGLSHDNRLHSHEQNIISKRHSRT